MKYQEQQFHFYNLITNGTFDTDTDWTHSGGFAITGGHLEKTSGGGNGASSGTPVKFKSDGRYTVNFNYVDLGTDLMFGHGYSPSYAGLSANPTDLNGTGAKTKTFAALDAKFFGFIGNNSWVGEIDNLSIFQIDANNDVIHIMPNGWLPKDVFINGLLQREGENYDYTVHTDGYDVWVKPSISPIATTTTTIIGVKS